VLLICFFFGFKNVRSVNTLLMHGVLMRAVSANVLLSVVDDFVTVNNGESYAFITVHLSVHVSTSLKKVVDGFEVR